MATLSLKKPKKKPAVNIPFSLDVDFYSMELKVMAKSAAEAKKKGKALIVRKILRHINNIYVEKD